MESRFKFICASLNDQALAIVEELMHRHSRTPEVYYNVYIEVVMSLSGHEN